jgi:hypothetical protein
MTFAFVAEDGTGLANATSYATVEQADTILETNPHASAWFALTTDQKEKNLSWASGVLDNHTRWSGSKAVEASALRWPRSGTYDRVGVAIGDNVVPVPVKVATAELARALIAEDRTAERDQDGLRRLKADVVELEFSEGYRLPTIPAHVAAILTGLGVTGGRSKRIIR